jgi:3-phosphoshikimate 1-carboxyvinyltransferase
LKIELEKARRPLKGDILPPPDKSISHRAMMFASISNGESLIRNYLLAADTMSTLSAMRMLGTEIHGVKGSERHVEGLGAFHREYAVEGRGLHGLAEPDEVMDCGNSGTTTRLLAGLLAGNAFFSVLTGDESLRSRPMARVITPLREMGARISARKENRFLPMAIEGGKLGGIRYEMPVASAQVKSALILAGLYAEGKTTIIEPGSSRDHTERMLSAQGADVVVEDSVITVGSGKELSPFDIAIPGDFSSAAFFIVAALLVPNSELMIRYAGVNEKRIGLIDVLLRMGADIRVENRRLSSGEPVADLVVKYRGSLGPAEVGKDEIPLLIDEVPVLCVAMAAAEGTSRIWGAGELRVKESDRLKAMAEGLRKMGTDVEEYPDGLSINGGGLAGAEIDSFGDHRIAMSFAIAALAARGKTTIHGAQAASISYPEFFDVLRRLSAGG